MQWSSKCSKSHVRTVCIYTNSMYTVRHTELALASEWERSTQPRQQQCLYVCKIVETRQLELGWKKGNWKWHTVHCLSTVVQWETDNKEQGAMDFVFFSGSSLLQRPFSTPLSLNRGVNRIASWVISKSPVYAWRGRRKNKSMDGQDKNNIVRRVSPVDATTHETRPTCASYSFFSFLFFLFCFRCCFRYFWMGWWAVKRFRGWKKRTWLEWLKSFPSSWACSLAVDSALWPPLVFYFLYTINCQSLGSHSSWWKLFFLYTRLQPHAHSRSK
jgi:hypothetical protein